MSQYGEDLGTLDFQKEHIYETFVDYFGNPSLTKTKNEGGYSIYMAEVYSQLSRDYRYLVVLVPQNDKDIGATERLMYLPWVSLQTRTLDYTNVDSFVYTPKHLPLLKSKIILTNKLPTSFSYRVDKLPLCVTLLPNSQEYQKEGTLLHALETFQTIITFE